MPSPKTIAATPGVALALVMNDASSTPAAVSGIAAAQGQASLAARLPLLAPKAIAWAQALAAQADTGRALSAPLRRDPHAS